MVKHPKYSIDDIEANDVISFQKSTNSNLNLPANYYSENRWLVLTVEGNNLTLKDKNNELVVVNFNDVRIFEDLRLMGGRWQLNYPNG